MPVIAMKVTDAKEHPNADSLRVYQLEAPGRKVQVVANMENVYQVPDLVYVALPGSVLSDGTNIDIAKVRGLRSDGMALGTVDGKLDAAPGDIFTDRFCDMTEENKLRIIRWPEIGNLALVRRGLDEMRANLGEEFSLPKVVYRPKIKLHGTNAAVQVHPDGRVVAQSRSNIIVPGDDNHGFAVWVDKNLDYWKQFANSGELTTFFGEWCGPGIQKGGTAISQIPNKVFAVFTIQSGPYYQAEPVVIADWLFPHFDRANFRNEDKELDISKTDHEEIFVIPWLGDYKFELDFGDREQLTKAVEPINQLVEEVEKLDPWVKKVFGIEGIGEGIVLYPITIDGGIPTTRNDYSDLMFKAKGEKHKVVNQKKPVQVDPEVAKNIAEFVNLFVTPARCEQGADVACEGVFEIKRMGNFLKWISMDIQKESVAELEASNLEWKQVAKEVMNAAKNWYQEQVNKI